MSAALELKLQQDRKLALLAAAVADYEKDFGEITAEEIVEQQRADREDAAVVRGGDLEQLAAASGRHVELIHP